MQRFFSGYALMGVVGRWFGITKKIRLWLPVRYAVPPAKTRMFFGFDLSFGDYTVISHWKILENGCFELVCAKRAQENLLVRKFNDGDKVRMVPPERLNSKYNKDQYSILYRNKTMKVLGSVIGSDNLPYYVLSGGSRKFQYAEDFLELA